MKRGAGVHLARAQATLAPGHAGPQVRVTADLAPSDRDCLLHRSAHMARLSERQAVERRELGSVDVVGLKSGRSGKKVTSRKQAIAIGLSEARAAGGKVPRKRSRKTTKKR